MNDVDRAIRESLTEEDTELFERLGADQALHRQVANGGSPRSVVVVPLEPDRLLCRRLGPRLPTLRQDFFERAPFMVKGDAVPAATFVKFDNCADAITGCRVFV